MEGFDFEKDYVLENEVVKLTPLKIHDFEKLSVFSLKEPELWQYSLQPANGLENLKKYMDIAFETKIAGTSYPFLVFDKRTNNYAGSTRFYDYQKEHATIQLGYTWYGKQFQGSGLNKQCKFLMLQFAFENLGLERVEFRADAKNDRSIAAMKSIGCKVEGILRNNCSAIKGRRDSIVLSILKDEWFGGVKEQLKTKIENENKLSNS